MTLEEAIAQAHAVGWRINNLFQTEAGWQCNLRGLGYTTGYGYAATPTAAVLAAIKTPPVQHYTSGIHNAKPLPSFDLDIGDL